MNDIKTNTTTIVADENKKELQLLATAETTEYLIPDFHTIV